MNPKGKSIGRQITLSITVASLCSTVLSISGFYLFYYLMEVFYPRWYDEPETIMPSGLEWLWIGLTASVVVIFATLVASRLTRRIITPLNSVAESLRRVASGDLEARARGGDTSMTEAATLVSDFNSMAERLNRMSENRVFWNAAIAHELRTPMTILRGRLQGIAEGVFEPGPEQFNSMLTQLEGLTRIIEDLRVVSLAESGHLDLRLQRSDVSVQVAAVVEAMSEALTESGFSVTLDARPSLADCDPARIRQAVLALLEKRAAACHSVSAAGGRHPGRRPLHRSGGGRRPRRAGRVARQHLRGLPAHRCLAFPAERWLRAWPRGSTCDCRCPSRNSAVPGHRTWWQFVRDPLASACAPLRAQGCGRRCSGSGPPWWAFASLNGADFSTQSPSSLHARSKGLQILGVTREAAGIQPLPCLHLAQASP